MYEWYIWSRFLITNFIGLLIVTFLSVSGVFANLFSNQTSAFPLSLITIFLYALYHTGVKSYKLSRAINNTRKGDGVRYNEFLQIARKSVPVATEATKDKMINKIEWIRTSYVLLLSIGITSVLYIYSMFGMLNVDSLLLAMVLASWTYFNYESLKNGVYQLISAMAKKYSE